MTSLYILTGILFLLVDMMLGTTGHQADGNFRFRANRITTRENANSQIPGLTEESFNFLWQQLGDVSDAEDHLMDALDGGPPHRRHSVAEETKFEVPAMSPGELDTKLAMFPGHNIHMTSELLENDSSMDLSRTSSPYLDSDSGSADGSPTANHVTSSTIPSNAEYAGQYGFHISFEKPPKETKSTTWTYSECHNKLFVRMATACPVRFRTTHQPPPGTIIRAMPVYLKPEHMQDRVRRCPNHATGTEHNDHHPAPTHLVRCDHQMAVYTEDPATGRHSVVVPHEMPQVGASWVTNLYQFMCFSSCVGGLNRRPLQLIFTLEVGGNVVGRQSVEVRICACPGRDRRVEERPANGPPAPNSIKRPTPTINMNLAKRRKDNAEEFTLHVTGRENYEILLRIRDSLELAACIPQNQINQYHQQQKQLQEQRATYNGQKWEVTFYSSQKISYY